jgi:hypothetical protein
MIFPDITSIHDLRICVSSKLNWIIGSTIFVCYLSQDGSMPRSLPGGASLSFIHEVIFVMLESSSLPY